MALIYDHPIQLIKKLDNETKRAWRDWTPAMLHEQYPKIPDDLLMATQVIATNPDVCDEWHLFHACCTAFNGQQVNFETLGELSIPELAWGCTVISEAPAFDGWGPGVLRYIAVLCMNHGIVYFPWTDMIVAKHPSLKGLIEDTGLGEKVKHIWERTDASDRKAYPTHDETDPLHVQLADLINAQAYVRRMEHDAAG